MNLTELFMIAIGLAMDAFAVSVTNGICASKKEPSRKVLGALLCALTFGLFQGAMPSLGYFIGMSFSGFIEKADHWIALLLLGFIGIKAIKGSREHKEEQENLSLSLYVLLVQGFATSVDALTAGITFAALGEGIVMSAAVIAAVTAILSAAGFFIGEKAGNALCSKAQLAGGILLVGIGVKIFTEHVFLN